MLAPKEALQVQNYVNSHLFDGKHVLTMEDAANMQPIPGTRNGGGSYTILATQYGDLTILVWVQYMEAGFMTIRYAHKQAW
ncbi:MAG: hypothetical protein IKF83_03675 [Clostridia bacterium]|nr:hypothetical protein [Clostridia bacterium]